MSLNPSISLRLVNGPSSDNETGTTRGCRLARTGRTTPARSGHPRPRRRAHESSERGTVAQRSTDTQAPAGPLGRLRPSVLVQRAVNDGVQLGAVHRSELSGRRKPPSPSRSPRGRLIRSVMSALAQTSDRVTLSGRTGEAPHLKVRGFRRAAGQTWMLLSCRRRVGWGWWTALTRWSQPQASSRGSRRRL